VIYGVSIDERWESGVERGGRLGISIVYGID
jgi:hypothetical protein